MAPKLLWPPLGKDRGPGYWLRPSNLLAGRRRLRSDHSNEWRYEFLRTSSTPPPPSGCDPDPEARSRAFSWLLGRQLAGGFRCAILGDTGEGDYSQYALLPILRHLKVDFMIINGDVAYPAGTNRDYTEGFFQPYAGLERPIWAVPGNHDYYSENRGREFHEIFCTELRRHEWDAARLVLRPQPGTYWELAEPPASKLVILGVDSGQAADLDGETRGFLGLGGRQPPDQRQYEWLAWRLDRAQRSQSSVVLLYHIPALVHEEHVKAVHLKRLHRLIAQYPCIRVVLTAHEHNYQRYDPTVFARYLDREHGAKPVAAAPNYFVSGAGGAYISATDFEHGTRTGYSAISRYPTAADWKQWAPLGLRLVAKAGLGKSVINRIAIGVLKAFTKLAEESDADRPERLSLVLLTHTPPATTTIQPYFIDDLAAMYANLPPDTPVRVQEGDPDIDPASMAGCCREAAISF
jgi:3',5'-cyclic AMP phosphodiesterase CpdA